MNKIPVSIVTGFLGAGKTTLLNHIIKNNPNKKLAIIENEIGSISIDSDLIVKSENGIFELSNGCVCCTLNGELLEILTKLINSSSQISHVVIETTGIADPGPVAFSFLADLKIQSAFKLDSIITLVDGPRIEQLLIETIEANKQIIQADLVLINKSALMDDYQKDVVKNIITKINTQAQILFTDYAKINDSDFFDRNSFDSYKIIEKVISEKKSFKISSSISTSQTNTSLLQKQGMSAAIHSNIFSYSFTFEESLDVIRFDIWLNAMLQGDLCKFYRVKGILQIEEFEEKVILQSVGDKFITESGGSWNTEEPKVSKIVFIGKNLHYQTLENGLKLCFYNENQPLPDENFYAAVMTNQVDMFLANNAT